MVDSFKVDHTKLDPGIYIHSTFSIGNTDIVVLDIRMVKPNTIQLQEYCLHSMEHLLAHTIKSYLFKNPSFYITISLNVMQCKTGFYLEFAYFNRSSSVPSTAIEHTKSYLALVKEALQTIPLYYPIPGNSARECGFYRTLCPKVDEYMMSLIQQIINMCDTESLTYPK